MDRYPHSDVPEEKPEFSTTYEEGKSMDGEMQSMHAQLLREMSEPTESFSAPPLLMVFLIASLTFWAGIYFIHYNGGFEWYVYDENLNLKELSEQAAGPVVFDPMKKGAQIFKKNCQVCHQVDGKGVPGAFPPLAGSDWVQGPEERLVRVLLHGMNGPVTVSENQFDGVMPSFLHFKDRDIAAVLTWLRTNTDFANQATAVSEEMVTSVRSQFEGKTQAWHGPDLQNMYKEVH